MNFENLRRHLPLDANNPRTFPSEFIPKIFKTRISRDEPLFKGYILVKFDWIFLLNLSKI